MLCSGPRRPACGGSQFKLAMTSTTTKFGRAGAWLMKRPGRGGTYPGNQFGTITHDVVGAAASVLSSVLKSQSDHKTGATKRRTVSGRPSSRKIRAVRDR